MAGTILIFGILLALSALFSGIEIAFFSLTPGRVRTMVRQGLYAATLVERMKQQPRRILITILIGNNLVNITLAALATELALSLFGSDGVAIATGAATFFILVFGEIFPKSFAQQYAGQTSRYTAPFVYALSIALTPIAWCLERFMDLLAIGRAQSAAAATRIAEEEIRSLFQIGYEKGYIDTHEREFAERLFRFNDAPVSSVEKPLGSAIMLDGSATIAQVAKEAAVSGYSRFPVFERERTRITGIVHIKDILKALPEHGDRALGAIAHPPLVVSKDEKLDDAFRRMRTQRVHYALVQDARGAIEGLVTLEDILEELVGEIYDESDRGKKGIVT